MEEIAQQFREELQEIVNRYKTRLSVPRIMHVAQDVFHKNLSVKYNPELHPKVAEETIKDLLKDLPKENIEGLYKTATKAAEKFIRETEAMAEDSWQSKCLWYKINADESVYKTGFLDGYNKANGDTECID